MLRNLREKSKGIVFIGLAGLLILSFAAWGIGDYINTASTPVVGEVAGRDISAREFQNRFRADLNTYANRFDQRFDAEQAITFGFHVRTLNSMVTERAFDAAVRDYGIAVSEDLVRRRIFETPAFQFEGNFDRATYQEALRRSGLTEEEFVAGLKQQIAGEILGEALLAAAEPPAILAREIYGYAAETRTADLLILPPEAAGEVPEPAEDTLRAFYEENAAMFTAPERRDATLVFIDPAAVAEEVAVTDEDLKAEFEARRNEFETPERRAGRMVIAETEAQAAEIKTAAEGGAELQAAARQAMGETAEVLPLGPVAREGLRADLAETVFAVDTGVVAGPVQSPFGWHVLIVDEIAPPETVSLDEVRDELEGDIRLRRAGDAVIDVANALEDEINSGATLEEAGQALGLEVRKLVGIDQSGLVASGERPGGLPQSDAILTTLFGLETDEPSLLEETEDGNFYVVRPDRIEPSALRPFDEVRDEVLAAWREDRREGMLAEKAEALRAAVPSEGPLDELAAEYGAALSATPAITRNDANPEADLSADLVAQIFTARRGEAVMAPAIAGYVVARVSDIRPADPMRGGERLDEIVQRIDENLDSELVIQFEAALRERFNATIDEDAARFVILGER